jgi:acetyl-CoA/propionyl-CoA carboxylase carboxyl transferase subunit
MSASRTGVAQLAVITDFRHPFRRLEKLLDPGSLIPLHQPDDSNAQAVRGQLGDADVIAYATDGSKMGGAIGSDGCEHIAAAIDLAVGEGCPVIGLWHSGGARLAEGIESMDGIGRMFAAMIRASGRIPQISVVLGPAAGGAAYGPALTDLVIMSPEGRIFVTGPDVVRSVTGEKIDMEGLGGPSAHNRSGVVHVVAASEDDAYAQARKISGLFTSPGRFHHPVATGIRDLKALLPESPRRAYDIRPLVSEILDPGAFQELQPKWAPNMMVGLGRLAGGTLGVIANNPLHKAGCLDSLSAEKAARFVRMCDSFRIPLLVIVDVPGYLPGVSQEWEGIVRRGAKLLYAFGEAVVPRVTLITRKSYGGAYIAMNSRALGASAVFAWPDAEIAVMNGESAVKILHRKRLAATPEGERAQFLATLTEEHNRVADGVARGVSLGLVDEVIQPAETRLRIASALAAMPRHGNPAAQAVHGNIPL